MILGGHKNATFIAFWLLSVLRKVGFMQEVGRLVSRQWNFRSGGNSIIQDRECHYEV